MKAEELMIGDWVYVKVQVDDTGSEPVYKTTHKRVTELTNTINGIYVEGDSTFAGAEITPIPLTKEILLENGFEDFSGGGCIIKELDDNEIPTLYIWDGNNSIYVVDYYSLNKYTYIKECKYVHEFQHELKSCGIKKDIML